MKPAIVTLALVIGLHLALPATADAAKYRAKNLHHCVATIAEWRAAPVGSELPFAGVRFYKRDGQRGYSVTFCLTAVKQRDEPEVIQHDGFTEYLAADPGGGTPGRIRFGRWLDRNVESVRLATAPGCMLTVDLLENEKRLPYPYRAATFGWDKRWQDGIVKLDREVPRSYDDRARRWWADYVCGDAKYDHEMG